MVRSLEYWFYRVVLFSLILVVLDHTLFSGTKTRCAHLEGCLLAIFFHLTAILLAPEEVKNVKFSCGTILPGLLSVKEKSD